jgi:hypothetical protein
VRRIRLTKKLAAALNGIDISALQVGDVIELSDSAARMMIAEGWAEAEAAPARSSLVPPIPHTVTPRH